MARPPLYNMLFVLKYFKYSASKYEYPSSRPRSVRSYKQDRLRVPVDGTEYRPVPKESGIDCVMEKEDA